MSNMNWQELASIEQLSEVDEKSKSNPVLIFKHSTRCSISAASLNRLERKWDNEKADSVETYFLDLIRFRDVSDKVTEKYGVVHQSPQAILIKDGKAIMDNSHFDISFEKITEELREALI